MGKSDTGKIIVVIGGLLGVIIVLLSLISPELGYWTLSETVFSNSSYLNAFGYYTEFNGDLAFTEDYLILFGGVLFIVGSIIAIVAGVKSQKNYSILSGLVMVGGLVLFCYALQESDTWKDAAGFLSAFNNNSTAFFGEWLIFNWSLSIGFYVSAVSAGITLIGAFSTD